MEEHSHHAIPDMSELFEMLNMITRRRKAAAGSPFATVKATEKWLKHLSFDSDYDTHHALVEGLERFNAEHEPASASRMKSLLKIEAAGLPLQRSLVEQYVRNQATFRLARQALWRETWSFWMHMGDAWLALLKQACRDAPGAGLRPQLAEIAVHALFYARQAMRWDYHQSRLPQPSAWRRANRIYRLVEREEVSQQGVKLDGRETHCAREYALTVMMGLVNPLGYRPEEIEAIAGLIEACRQLPLPNTKPMRHTHTHTHVVDLSLDEGASVMGDALIEGKRLRYFGLRGVIETLKSDAPPEDQRELARQVANLIERGGIRRNRHRSHRFGSAWVTSGIDNILAALAHPEASDQRLLLEPWTLRDESMEGMGLVLPTARSLPNGRLLAVNLEPSENAWQVLAVRWTREEDGQHLVGVQRLSRHPKRVEVEFEAHAGQDTAWGVLLPMTTAEQGMSNLLIPASHYRAGAMLALRDGAVAYRLRLGEVQETHEGWLRVGMEVVGREQLAVAA